VIQAGLAKIARTNGATLSVLPSLPVLIDLCALPEPMLRNERLAIELATLKAQSACQDRPVIVAAPVPGLGDADSRESGLELLQSQPAREAAMQAACTLYADRLEALKQTHSKTSAPPDERGDELAERTANGLSMLQSETANLSRRIALAQDQLRSLLDAGVKKSDALFEQNAARLATAEQTLTRVLEKHGLLERALP